MTVWGTCIYTPFITTLFSTINSHPKIVGVVPKALTLFSIALVPVCVGFISYTAAFDASLQGRMVFPPLAEGEPEPIPDPDRFKKIPSIVYSEVAAKGIPLMLSSASVWPMINLVNFKFMPPQHRVAFMSFMSVGWNAYASGLVSGDFMVFA